MFQKRLFSALQGLVLRLFCYWYHIYNIQWRTKAAENLQWPFYRDKIITRCPSIFILNSAFCAVLQAASNSKTVRNVLALNSDRRIHYFSLWMVAVKTKTWSSVFTIWKSHEALSGTTTRCINKRLSWLQF